MLKEISTLSSHSRRDNILRAGSSSNMLTIVEGSENFRDQSNKHEVLLDFCYVQQITRDSITHSILSTLEKHKNDIKSCRGQAYNTSSSMSTSNVGVQAHINKVALDADYQGCCLHSLNLVVCKSLKITAIRSMFDSCQPAYLFFTTLIKGRDFLSM